MTTYSPHEIATITGGTILAGEFSDPITDIVLDTRKAVVGRNAVFFAITGSNHNGHDYLQAAWDKGIRSFVVEQDMSLPETTVIKVEHSVTALQGLAAHHRNRFDIPIIGITGSNGKTIVKEWLNQLLSSDYQVVRSPRSYNSQIGVPLSLWNIDDQHTLGIFEVGISQPGEMEAHAQSVNPTISILTNVLAAHAENFSSREQHINEKLKLAHSSQLVILPDQEEILKAAKDQCSGQLFTWGTNESADLWVREEGYSGGRTRLHCSSAGEEYTFSVPFSDKASIENISTCIATMLVLGFDFTQIEPRLDNLHGIGMRLESIVGSNDTHIINDAYSMDVDSLQIACEFTARMARHDRKVAVLSDLPDGQNSSEQYGRAASILASAGFETIFSVGTGVWNEHGPTINFPSVDALIQSAEFAGLKHADVLIKGARSYRFEQIVDAQRAKIHRTRLEINLAAMERNLSVYRSLCPPDSLIMCMVKASAYGSGSTEVAQLLEFNKVDYLGVAYVDEGVKLRQAGCSLPIMVMNPDLDNINRLEQYNLEPEVYSMAGLRKVIEHGSEVKIHLKIDTGMHRLGFEKRDLAELKSLLGTSNAPRVASMFSHLAASEDQAHDEFSRGQITLFEEIGDALSDELDYPIIRHMANTAGISRFPEAAFDMVRLGIGLYGVKTHRAANLPLDVVLELKSTISQIKKLSPGESIGYGRSFIAAQQITSATVPIGYADGLIRSLSDGKGRLIINGKPAPILGKVCMDMVMVDVSAIDCAEGDEVEIFGQQQNVEDLAAASGTIAYEVIASIPERVTRVFLQE